MSLQKQGNLATDTDESSVTAAKLRLRFNRQSSLRHRRKNRQQQQQPRCDREGIRKIEVNIFHSLSGFFSCKMK